MPKLEPAKPVNAVESSSAVTLGEGRVVKNILDEKLHASAIGEDGLTDMHEFRGAVADDMDAQELKRVAVKDSFINPSRSPTICPRAISL